MGMRPLRAVRVVRAFSRQLAIEMLSGTDRQNRFAKVRSRIASRCRPPPAHVVSSQCAVLTLERRFGRLIDAQIDDNVYGVKKERLIIRLRVKSVCTQVSDLIIVTDARLDSCGQRPGREYKVGMSFTLSSIDPYA